jgi:hypothetical protein
LRESGRISKTGLVPDEHISCAFLASLLWLFDCCSFLMGSFARLLFCPIGGFSRWEFFLWPTWVPFWGVMIVWFDDGGDDVMMDEGWWWLDVMRRILLLVSLSIHLSIYRIWILLLMGCAHYNYCKIDWYIRDFLMDSHICMCPCLMWFIFMIFSRMYSGLFTLTHKMALFAL